MEISDHMGQLEIVGYAVDGAYNHMEVMKDWHGISSIQWEQAYEKYQELCEIYRVEYRKVYGDDTITETEQ